MQLVNTLLPLADIAFVGHDVHDDPASEYVLTVHVIQSAGSSDPDKDDVPALQLVHSEPANEYVLAIQLIQLLTSVEPAAEDFPAAHFKHVVFEVAARVAEYVPLGHAIHEEPAGEYVPAPQFTQSTAASDPGGDDLPATQFTQEVSVVAPVVARYLPVSQLVHATVPIVVLYFPSAHAAHVPPFGPVKPGLQTQLAKRPEP